VKHQPPFSPFRPIDSHPSHSLNNPTTQPLNIYLPPLLFVFSLFFLLSLSLSLNHFWAQFNQPICCLCFTFKRRTRRPPPPPPLFPIFGFPFPFLVTLLVYNSILVTGWPLEKSNPALSFLFSSLGFFIPFLEE